MDVLQIVPCDESHLCLNSVERAGIDGGKCGICRLSPTGHSRMNYWKPSVPGTKHPGLIAVKKQEKLDKHIAQIAKKRNADIGRRRLLIKASQAEKTTERNLIRATKNSGRSNKDGDHIAVGEITLDTKLQTTRENPVVLLHELHKVGEDAKRAGNWMGALVLRNTNGIGVVAMTESDFARLIQRIQ